MNAQQSMIDAKAKAKQRARNKGKKNKEEKTSKIGNLGKLIVFSVSEKKMLTFDSFKFEVSAKWSDQERLGRKPVSEFLSPELRQISFNIVLDASHGVKPMKTIREIASAIENGNVYPLVIGGKRISKKHYWRIMKMSSTWDCIYNKGELARATLELTLKEYV